MLNTDDMHDFKQCRRNDFGMGGGAKKLLRSKKSFNHTFFPKGYNFVH